MAIDKKTVEHVAKLARLNLSEADSEKFTKQLDAILEYAGELQKVDTAAVEASEHSFQAKTIMREDEAKPFTDFKLLIKNGPATEETFYSVPKILSE